MKLHSDLRTIAVVTGSRAEYGLLRPVCKLIEQSEFFDLRMLVTGSHLSSVHGNTYQEVVNDHYRNIEYFDLNITGSSPLDINNALALSVQRFGEYFDEIKSDLLIVLGDRYEVFGAAIAAMMHLVPIAHIHGGELTQGAYDDSIRHSISKMSHLHFTSTEAYKSRIVQMGENSDFVFHVGGLGAEAIQNLKLLDKETLETELNFSFNERNLLVTYHPETMARDTTLQDLHELLNALNTLENDTNLIFTMPNADTGYQQFFDAIQAFVNKDRTTRVAFTSLGQLRYFSCLQYVDGVIGNSSSGILEAPSFKIATINIGNRQAGRVMANSVINVGPSKSEIIRAINSIYREDFKEKIKTLENPYYKPGSAMEIVKIIEKHKKISLEKTFVDL